MEGRRGGRWARRVQAEWRGVGGQMQVEEVDERMGVALDGVERGDLREDAGEGAVERGAHRGEVVEEQQPKQSQVKTRQR